ncbi:MAG: HlyD family efflux transporter periplasmic adaptor subunit [Ectothiorhodospiraceae bacterium]|jgi:membrane fusion protein|nr:HlyD family efflux transporter periplasmic adaptor subunit [Ectothiorhodospiraceae bacterium]
MAQQHLFRRAALAAQKPKAFGQILLVRPLAWRLLSAAAVLCALAIVMLFTWGSYTKRSSVTGQLVPSAGLLRIYPPQTGIVGKKLVAEGQSVKAGDTLYLISSERQSSTLGSVFASVSEQLGARKESLTGELERTRQLQREEQEGLTRQVAALRSELEKIDSLLEGQRARVALAEETSNRYQSLLEQDYISLEQRQQKREELLDQQTRLKSVEREQIALRRELGSRQESLDALRFKHENQLAQIERVISSTSQELSESEGRRMLAITAPIDGTATAVVAEVGQAVDGRRPLLSIVPAGSRLEAQLYAPSRAVGFVRPGAEVLMRYQAYPYQKFGHARGIVVSVARTALPGSEISSLLAPGTEAQGSEPLYLISVALEQQSINAYGVAQPLQAGMLLEADVLQESRKLYEWVLEPLFSLSGKL